LWPETEVSKRPRFGRDRVESRHNSDIAEVRRLTHHGHEKAKVGIAGQPWISIKMNNIKMNNLIILN
jgi:hypothetical protein